MIPRRVVGIEGTTSRSKLRAQLRSRMGIYRPAKPHVSAGRKQIIGNRLRYTCRDNFRVLQQSRSKIILQRYLPHVEWHTHEVDELQDEPTRVRIFVYSQDSILPSVSSNVNHSAHDAFYMQWDLCSLCLGITAEDVGWSAALYGYIPSKRLMAACKWLKDYALSQKGSWLSRPWPNMIWSDQVPQTRYS